MRSEASTIDTGSSATISVGLRDQRPRDRRCAAAGRPTARAGSGRATSAQRQADLAQRLVGARSASRAGRRRRRSAGPSGTGSGRARFSGLKASNGFWKIGCTWRHEGDARRARRGSCARSVPRKRIVPRARRHDAEDHARQRRLAAAGLADDGEDLGRARLESEADVVDRRDAPAREAGRPSRTSWRHGRARAAARHAVPPPPLTAKQATRWSGRELEHRPASRGGRCPSASGQRGWKRQPGGGSARLGGAPVERLPSASSSPMRGRLAIRCAV